MKSPVVLQKNYRPGARRTSPLMMSVALMTGLTLVSGVATAQRMVAAATQRGLPVVSAASGCRYPTGGLPALSGLAYGPFRTGESPNQAVYPSSAEVVADMPTLACLTRTVRIYSSLGAADDVVRAARAAHLTVDLGIWLGRNAAVNNKEIAAGLRLAADPAVTTLTVGNEVLLRRDLTEKQLRGIVQRVRQQARKLHHRVEVTTADVDAVWLAHRGLSRDVDAVTVHLYPFWQKVAIDRAIATLSRSYARIRAAFPGKPILIGETGWPSAGPAQGAARPGQANQARYLKEFVNWARRQKPAVRYYYFDAFDEDWKTTESGVGTHWGLYSTAGVLKPSLRLLLPPAAPATTEDRASRDVFVGGLQPGYGISLSSSGNLTGWAAARQGVIQLTYPSGQQWAAMALTVASTATTPATPASIDAHGYASLSLDLKAAQPGQCAYVGIKDAHQSDNGSEMTVRECPGIAWASVLLPLDAFTGVDLSHLSTLAEVVVRGNQAQTIWVRNVRLSLAPAPVLPTPEAEAMPFTVYDDAYSLESHFFPSGFMGDFNHIKVTQDSPESPHSGRTCTRASYTPDSQGPGWAGVYWQDPPNNWGTTLGRSGYDLRNATHLTFWARGASGGERITFEVGGVQGANPDSLQPAATQPVVLTTGWQQFTIDLAGRNLTHIIGGFAWVARAVDNPQGTTTFYLDDIAYD